MKAMGIIICIHAKEVPNCTRFVPRITVGLWYSSSKCNCHFSSLTHLKHTLRMADLVEKLVSSPKELAQRVELVNKLGSMYDAYVLGVAVGRSEESSHTNIPNSIND